jgi:hypothetical protein
MVTDSCRWLIREGEQEKTCTAHCALFGSVFRLRALLGESAPTLIAPTLHWANSFGLIRIPTDTGLHFSFYALSSRTEKHGAALAHGSNGRACGCAVCSTIV